MIVKKLKYLIPALAFFFASGIWQQFLHLPLTPGYSQEAKPAGPAGQTGKKTEMVAMRDSVKLATDVYLPEGAGPWPVVLMRTPYNKESMGSQNRQWVSNGYVFVVQDCRGRFKSEGKYMPFMDDHLDG